MSTAAPVSGLGVALASVANADQASPVEAARRRAAEKSPKALEEFELVERFLEHAKAELVRQIRAGVSPEKVSVRFGFYEGEGGFKDYALSELLSGQANPNTRILPLWEEMRAWAKASGLNVDLKGGYYSGCQRFTWSELHARPSPEAVLTAKAQASMAALALPKSPPSRQTAIDLSSLEISSFESRVTSALRSLDMKLLDALAVAALESGELDALSSFEAESGVSAVHFRAFMAAGHEGALKRELIEYGFSQGRFSEKAPEKVQPSPFVTTKTTHSAQVNYGWSDEFRPAWDQKEVVMDAVDHAANEAAKKHGVQLNSELGCQWEGVEFTGDSLANVISAANDVAQALGMFKSVVPYVVNAPEPESTPSVELGR